MSASIKGHALQDEGAAYVVNERQQIVRARYGSYGRGLCECGEMSDMLDSGRQRKQWHRDHKASLQ